MLVLACPAFSDQGCSGKFSLADDGAIADWTICSYGIPLQIVNSSEGQFRIKFFSQSLPPSVDKQWHQSLSSGDAGEVFRFTDADRSIEIRRTFRSSADDAIIQSISITNMTAKTVLDFNLALVLSDGAMEEKPGFRSN